ncbi:unnamed protein product [Caenorhabditis auriculariae]|uniref:Uncharacterized protein n=1 Tax=Caenorhabditis auriculariae TaxID=2777116 RepID=A0A8S1HBB3_9PELO|nr:unnamed protein product [Caenorhabditis auriculariae]
MNFNGGYQLDTSLHHFPCSSAALLSSDTTVQQPVLRKSSSAIDWNGAVVEATRKASQQLDWHGALFNNNRKTSFAQFGNQLPTVEDHQQGGLVMSSSPADNNKGMSVVTAQMPAQKTHLAQNIATTAATSLEARPAETHQEPHRERGGMLGVFQRGFFSRPIVRSEEENYRYIMALDR